MALKNITMPLAALAFLLMAGCGGHEAPAPSAPAAAESVAVSTVPVTARQDPEGTSRLVVPATALFHEGAMTGVLVVGEDGRIAVRWVSAGHRAGSGIVVLAGLDAGELVVGSYDPALRNGIKATKSQAVTEEVQSK